MNGDRIKVWFRFVPREGWLPQDTEGLWATPVGAGTARVDNVPFLQNGVAQGDVVRYTTAADGTHWATERLTASGNCTLRVLPDPSGPLGPSARAVHERLTPFALGGESFSADFPLLAVNVPADAPFGEIKELLAQGEEEGWWHWEMGCATEEWAAA
ncbi:DUF4265 domain-containing protein [Streptomyces sp. ISL-36]|uniref:DUF4265 domain-containing protein n=1 Tax=Streptomyces sp. ISL-36 TaxID=2819182 RepID=UPI001BE66494|nr:DUF4265 domain-containing protein [Streptomyces sp. ISL-36]MBT2438747.1 DUF4265 domain-containing protein [Streptomyces sp. ISL-36]